jgi:hypothetical protein
LSILQMEHLGYVDERAMNITVREGLRTRGEELERVIMKELNKMITKCVWTSVDGRKITAEERRRIIRSSMFLQEKYLASGESEKLKARLVAGGCWLVTGGWWLVAGGWWLVAGGWWLVAGGWWLVEINRTRICTMTCLHPLYPPPRCL